MAFTAPFIGNCTADVNGDFTARDRRAQRSCYRAMELAEILERIDRRLKVVGLSANAASKRAKKPDAIRNIQRAVENGDRQGVSTATINALAPVLKTTAVWLFAGAGPESTDPNEEQGREAPATEAAPPSSEEVSEVTGVRTVKAAYGGVVEAGSWREVEDFDDLAYDEEHKPITEAADREFPDLPLFYYEVAGDSMNNLKPRAILPGDRVLGIPYAAFRGNFVLRDGMVVIVEQTEDGGHRRERSVKQVELYEDRIEFHPRSTNKKHKPIVVPRTLFTDPADGDGREVNVLAVCRRVTNELPL